MKIISETKTPVGTLVKLDMSDELEILQEDDIYWCECRTETQAYFHDDNTCKYVDQHHWHCSDCDGIEQIG